MTPKPEEIHKKAREWYDGGVVPCRRELQQDICAWYSDNESQLREVMTLAFFYGYVQALEEMKNYDNSGVDGEKSVAAGVVKTYPDTNTDIDLPSEAKGETKI